MNQDVLNIACDRAGYDLELDHRAPANPPLPTQRAEWADALLRSKGLR
jgi:hypothetical protein